MAALNGLFANAEGEMLAAKLELPVNQHPHSYALFAHCYTCSKNLSAVRNISQALNLSGVAVLRFDFTGLGESEGDFEKNGVAEVNIGGRPFQVKQQFLEDIRSNALDDKIKHLGKAQALRVFICMYIYTYICVCVCVNQSTIL